MHEKIKITVLAREKSLFTFIEKIKKIDDMGAESENKGKKKVFSLPTMIMYTKRCTRRMIIKKKSIRAEGRKNKFEEIVIHAGNPPCKAAFYTIYYPFIPHFSFLLISSLLSRVNIVSRILARVLADCLLTFFIP